MLGCDKLSVADLLILDLGFEELRTCEFTQNEIYV